MQRLEECTFEPSHSLSDYSLYICYLWAALTVIMEDNSESFEPVTDLASDDSTNGMQDANQPTDSTNGVQDAEQPVNSTNGVQDGDQSMDSINGVQGANQPINSTNGVQEGDGIAADGSARYQDVATVTPVSKKTLASVMKGHMYQLAFSLCNGLFLSWIDPAAMNAFREHLDAIEMSITAGEEVLPALDMVSRVLALG